MKTKSCYFAILIVCSVVASSCLKQEGNGGKLPEKVSELVVPAGFDWKTSKSVFCDFSSAQKNVRVAVALDNISEPFASFVVGKDGVVSGAYEKLSLSVPSYVNELYVSYDKSSGMSSPVKVVVGADNKATFTIPADGNEFVEAAAPQMLYSRAGSNDQDQYVTYPSSGWGTLLFEDLWPGYGDYDFNDLVVNYKIQLYPHNRNKINEMLLGIRVKAIGGSLPSDIYLSLVNVKGGEIGNIEFLEGYGHNEPADAGLVALNSADYEKDQAVLMFKGIKKRFSVAGAKYMNTEPGYQMSDDDLIEAVFLVTFRNSISINALGADSFDFFIASKDEHGVVDKEIHGGGYAPVFSDDIYNRVNKGHINTNKSRDYYYSNTHLVWALNIPDMIPHAYETIDFMKAYPNFAKWAKSGGTLYQDWYKNESGYRVKEHLFKPKE